MKTETIHTIRSISVTITGRHGSPLVMHAFAEKAKQEIRDKQQKKSKQVKAERVPEIEFLASRYVDGNGRECIPITAIKKALVSAATAFEDITKVGLRQALFVDCANSPGSDLIPIENMDGTPAIATMREDAVTIGINTRALTYRPEYKKWKIAIIIEFNSRIVSEEQILGLLDHAGWGIGIGEGRPEKTSALGWGRFERVD